ncbi:putative receptor-like protein kinase At3g47110 [Beta vulgaris subsp. vulgaris]|uniref:putative receptor-like protein kinase At3g47110 n=1 Tax=Beta vulgaris subsp. vulgaris TaxID=3555 RepID=UPI00254709C0|nr:putative receptor-like protein kinase At3g47110 [Beta vulgaris subsp. vulgaris]
MTNLYVFALMSNKLIGMIPPSVFNLSSLEILSLGMNQLQGSIPQDIAFTLPRLQHLLLYNNYLSGPFPMSLPNLTSILRIELSTNHFSGKIPAYLGRLHNLKHLELDVNSFVGDISFINSLVNCSQLEVLYLGANNFTGTLPQSIANLSTNLLVLDISKNPISNRGIPVGISNLNNLRYLWLSGLGLTGTIPQDIGKLQKLEWLDLYSNKLIGEIPSSLGNLSRLSRLYLYDNQLQGKIAPSLGNCANLLYLSLSYNRFNGSLPNELFAKTNFIQLNLGFNHLEGFLPMEIGKQINMEVFVVSRNKFIGEIPTVFGSLPDLQYLYMGDNFFHGPVPPSFITSLKSLLELDLSLNNLSGPVPEDASSFPLIYLNLSYNNFEGRVPTKGVYLNATAISLVGNNKLCGGISALHLPICVEKDRKKRRMTFALKLTIIVICTFVGVLVMLTCIWLYFTSLTRKRKSVSSDAPVKESHLKVSYNMLLKATEGFCSENLLGSGSFGSVFKGTLDGKTVAVKVLNLQHRGGSKSFMAECEALRNIRHRNLVGILTVCSSTDFQRNDFKALIYELMPNGSLENWLHRDRNLSLLQRLDIAIDVAYALNYLHHECDNQIVHCDLKPSNILLDHDMVAHVADFGLAKVLGLSQHPYQSSSVGVRGTIGYVAPEYGLGGEVSPEADLYSFGILLLELMTRKRPTDEMFKEDFNLHMYAKGALPDQVLQIVDTTQLIEHENEEDDNRQPRTQTMLQMKEECIVSVVKIGVACSNQSPSDRMNMIAAISELQRAKKILVH